MSHNKEQNVKFYDVIILWALLGIFIGLSVGLLFLYANGQCLQASSYAIATGLVWAGVVVSIALGIIYLVRRQLNSKGLCPDEKADERAKSIQYKAAFRTLQCLSLVIFVAPIFLFLVDYKLSLGWMLLSLFLLINLLYIGFIFYFSRQHA